MPRRFYLKRNAGTEAPTALLFFDTESHSRTFGPDGMRTDLRLRLWTACYVRREGRTFREPIWHQGTTAGEFWKLLDALGDWRRCLWMFAHNLGHDLTQLCFWDELESKRYTAGPVDRGVSTRSGKARKPWYGRLCLENRPTFLVVRGFRGTYKMVDSGNYWPSKLEVIGKRLGYPKLKVDFETVGDDELFTYCKRDTDICRVAVCELLEWWLAEDCGTFQVTAPMLAMTNWRHTTRSTAKDGETTSVVFEHDSPARKPERESAYGGWVEPFYLGKYDDDCFHVDANSFYPFIMRDGLFPRARVRSPGAANLSELAGWVEAYGAVALVQLDTRRDPDTYPCRVNRVQLHASGVFTTWLCGAELKRACQKGHVREVFDAHLYSIAPLFTDWCNTWLARRAAAHQANDQGREEFCKLILDSLNGKWAQRGDVWQDDPAGPVRRGWGMTAEHDLRTNELVQWRWIAGHVQKKVNTYEPLRAFPAIYGFITAAAREFMKSVFGRMPERSVMYTATDSIICTKAGYRALEGLGLIHPSEPGKFKLKAKAKGCEINGPNWYRFGDEWVIGGYFGKATRDKHGNYWCDVWDRLGSLLHANPGGVCGFTRTKLKNLVAVKKNDAAGDGWRRPYRYTTDHDMTDPTPHLPAPIFME